MTVTVKIELSPEMEEELQQSIVHKNAENISRILSKALAPTVEKMLKESSDLISGEQFETLTDELVSIVSDNVDSQAPVLSDQALSRESIYANHP